MVLRNMSGDYVLNKEIRYLYKTHKFNHKFKRSRRTKNNTTHLTGKLWEITLKIKLKNYTEKEFI